MPALCLQSIVYAGSVKLGRTCTSYIKMRTDITKRVFVEFCRHHTGHEIERKHLRLSDTLRSTVGRKLMEGVTVSKVLQLVRDNAMDLSPRDKLLTHRDILNIARRMSVNCLHKDVDDAAEPSTSDQQSSSVNGLPVPADIIGKDTVDVTALQRQVVIQCNRLLHASEQCDDAAALKCAINNNNNNNKRISINVT